MVFDEEEFSVILFGGMDPSFAMSNECWYLDVSGDMNSRTGPLFSGIYNWASCDPVGDIKPSPRYGHGSATFRGSLYIFGGFASDGLQGTVAQDDMWSLSDYSSNGTWEEVMPTTANPKGRAYFGYWLSGFQLYIHGGEGSGTTFQDTWSFNFYTRVWSAQSNTDVSLAASRLSVASANGMMAVSFGGRSQQGVALGQLYSFNTTSGWATMLAAGPRPSRRSGHLAGYDVASNRMIVSLGMGDAGVVTGSTWILSLEDKTWTCLHGERCAAATPIPPYGPGPRGFAASCQSDTYVFAFGGFSYQCFVSGARLPIGHDDLWAFNLAALRWAKVQTATVGGVSGLPSPPPRFMAALVPAGRQFGLKSPLILLGGGSFDCMAAGCSYPFPLDDIWFMDVSHGEPQERAASDKMAEFGGDDFIVVNLPAWCAAVHSMGVLWIDAWVFMSKYSSVGSKPIILFDAYDDQSPMLRWFVQGGAQVDGETTSLVTLALISSSATEVTVKQWGPIKNSVLLELWHHVAFTLRFARISSSSSCSTPMVALTQAHFFLDAQPVISDDSFLSIDILSALVLDSGIVSFTIGGVNPAIVTTSTHQNFVGAIDNVRIWWPSCPIITDPSRCNPYAFIYPVLQDGTRMPAAGIADADVTLDLIARPILQYMFVDNLTSVVNGLLVYLTFDDPSASGTLESRSAWLGPDDCTGSLYYETCPGCEQSCVFGMSGQFDSTCLQSAVTDGVDGNQAVQEYFGNLGTCKCNDITGCPSLVQGCTCPAGLDRVCTLCQIQVLQQDGKMAAGICVGGAAANTICISQMDCGVGGACEVLDPRFCPDALCTAWGCACLSTGSSLVLGQNPTVNREMGTGTCACDRGKSMTAMPATVVEPGQGPTFAYTCCTRNFLRDRLCRQWNSTFKGGITTWRCIQPADQPAEVDPSTDCGISSCCLTAISTPDTSSGSGQGSGSVGDGNTPGTTAPSTSGGLVCTLTGLTQGTWVGSFTPVESGTQTRTGIMGTQGAHSFDSIKQGRGTQVRQTLRNVIFEGVFIPESRLNKNSNNRSSLQQQTSSNGKYIERMVGAHNAVNLPVELSTSDSISQQARRGPMQHARRLTQANAAPPVFVSLQLQAAGLDCDQNKISCKKVEELKFAIQTAAQGNGITLDSSVITVTLPCTCSVTGGNAGGATTAAANAGSATTDVNAGNMTTDSSASTARNDRSTTNPGAVTAGENTNIVTTTSAAASGEGGNVTMSSAASGPVGGASSARAGRNRYLLQAKALLLNVTVLIVNPTKSQSIEQAKLVAAALQTAVAVSGLVLQVSSAPSVVYCGDGIRQTASHGINSNGILYTETCDDGVLNDLYGPCSSRCTCNEPAFKLNAANTSCLCQSDPNIKAVAMESSRLESRTNIITISVKLLDEYIFDYTKPVPFTDKPLIITFSNLTGTLTDSGTLNITCLKEDGAPYPCGLRPNAGSSEFRLNKAEWSKGSGTLQFTVLQELATLRAGSDTFTTTFMLTNNANMQDARVPLVSTCSAFPIPVVGMVLQSGAAQVVGPRDDSPIVIISKVNSAGSTVKVLSATFLGAVDNGVTITISGVQSSLMPSSAAIRLPVGAEFAALHGVAGLEIAVTGTQVSPISFKLEVPVDRTRVKTKSGCVKSPDQTLELCMPGYVGLYTFQHSAEVGVPGSWRSITPIDSSAMTAETIKSTVTSAGIYALLTTPQCSDVDGASRAGGDKVCLFYEARTLPMIQLGGLSISSMPTMTKSTRPVISTASDLAKYLNSTFTGTLNEYTPRSSWRRFCPSGDIITTGDCPVNRAGQLAWMPGRFGHSATAVTANRIVVFGGLGCGNVDDITGFCTGLTVLNDLWEFNIQSGLFGKRPLTQLLLSPRPRPLIGQTVVAFSGESQRVRLFGGGSAAFPYFSILGAAPPETVNSDVFQVQELLFRVGKASVSTLESVGSISFHSTVVTDTEVVMFGGNNRNSISSALYTYNLDAVSPSLGLGEVVVVADNPIGRSNAGLISRSALSLLMFGGVVERQSSECTTDSNNGGTCCASKASNWDIWSLDLGSTAWAAIPKTWFSTDPLGTSFGAFSSFTLGDNRIIALHGGIQCGYMKDTTFQSICSTAQEGTSACMNRVISKLQVVFVLIFDGSLHYFMMSFRTSTRGRAIPEARALHAMQVGSWLADGTSSGLLYGGIDGSGRALSDLWVTDPNFVNGFCIQVNIVILIPGAVTSADDVLDVMTGIPSCSAELRSTIYPSCETARAPAIVETGNGKATLFFTTPYSAFEGCLAPLIFDQNAFNIMAAMKNSSLRGAFYVDPSGFSFPGISTEVRFDWFQFQPRSPADGCSTYCVNGFCQFSNGSSSDRAMARCYGDTCGAGSFCSLPGPLHGHKLVVFSFAGKDVLLMFGGESTDLDADVASLSSDLHSAYFQGSRVSWVQMPLGYLDDDDGAKYTCAYSKANDKGKCPLERRDAAIILMGNEGGENGRLLLFGGMSYCQSSPTKICTSESPVLTYLSGTTTNVPTALNDLWYLDLSPVTIECLTTAVCSTLLWNQIPVNGMSPAPRWGASITLNSYSQTLYVTGGVTFSADGGRYSNLNHLYSYQLNDAYYTQCAAVGDGLQSAMAGQQASFTITCKDVFGEPTSNAILHVQITGAVSLAPSVRGDSGEVGTFQCFFTAAKAGDYIVQVKVGRGGTEFREYVAGGQNVALKVVPGATSPTDSIAIGSFLTLSTAGTAGSFTILSSDSLGNRRPGGDAIDVLMYYTLDAAVFPVAAQVGDNSDGTYAIQYSITRAGGYALHISFAGALGARSPTQLFVQTAAVDITMTYGYGDIFQAMAGVTSKVFLQTRDSYGNNVIVDTVMYPSGTEDLEFELCKTVGSDPTASCGGGSQESGVSTTQQFGIGPDNSNTNPATQLPYYGLYQIAYFPFYNGVYQLLVKHNGTFVQCLFDTSKLVRAVDPGSTKADECILNAQIAVATSRSVVGNGPPSSIFSSVARRAVVAAGGLRTVINSTFEPPDTTFALYWTFWGPIFAAIVGVSLDFLRLLIPALVRFASTCRRGSRPHSGAKLNDGTQGSDEAHLVGSAIVQSSPPPMGSNLVFTSSPVDRVAGQERPGIPATTHIEADYLDEPVIPIPFVGQRHSSDQMSFPNQVWESKTVAYVADSPSTNLRVPVHHVQDELQSNGNH